MYIYIQAHWWLPRRCCCCPGPEAARCCEGQTPASAEPEASKRKWILVISMHMCLCMYVG